MSTILSPSPSVTADSLRGELNPVFFFFLLIEPLFFAFDEPSVPIPLKLQATVSQICLLWCA